MLSRYCDDSQHSHHFRRQRELNIAHLVLEEHPRGHLSSISPGFLLIDFLKKKLFTYLTEPGLSCGSRDLQLWCANS